MPAFDTEENIIINTGSLKYSGDHPNTVTTANVTIGGICVDISGSVSSFKKNLENALNAGVEGCQKDKNSESLMLRINTFNSYVNELEGFRAVRNMTAKYSLSPGGLTALYDATIDMIDSIEHYAINLQSRADINTVVFIITDGANTENEHRRTELIQKIQKMKSNENLDSAKFILVGVNAQSSKSYLDKLQKDLDIDEFIDINDFDADKAAKLGGFISKSVSMTYKSMGTGAIAQSIQFS